MGHSPSALETGAPAALRTTQKLVNAIADFIATLENHGRSIDRRKIDLCAFINAE
jgi:hypothetical protein